MSLDFLYYYFQFTVAAFRTVGQLHSLLDIPSKEGSYRAETPTFSGPVSPYSPTLVTPFILRVTLCGLYLQPKVKCRKEEGEMCLPLRTALLPGLGG